MARIVRYHPRCLPRGPVDSVVVPFERHSALHAAPDRRSRGVSSARREQGAGSEGGSGRRRASECWTSTPPSTIGGTARPRNRGKQRLAAVVAHAETVIPAEDVHTEPEHDGLHRREGRDVTVPAGAARRPRPEARRKATRRSAAPASPGRLAEARNLVRIQLAPAARLEPIERQARVAAAVQQPDRVADGSQHALDLVLAALVE